MLKGCFAASLCNRSAVALSNSVNRWSLEHHHDALPRQLVSALRTAVHKSSRGIPGGRGQSPRRKAPSQSTQTMSICGRRSFSGNEARETILGELDEIAN